MEVIMQVAIDSYIYSQAQAYAEQKGQDLNALIERYLLLLISRDHEASQDAVPDVIANLLGAGKPLEEDDINGRKAYMRYLEEKHQ